MQENQSQPRKLSFGEKLVGYLVVIGVLVMLFYFFKSGAWTFFAPVK